MSAPTTDELEMARFDRFGDVDTRVRIYARYIRWHDQRAEVRTGADGRPELWALDVWTTQAPGGGSVAHEEWVRLEPRAPTIRRWLGY